MKTMISRLMHALFSHGRDAHLEGCARCHKDKGQINPRGGYLLAHHLAGYFDLRWYMGFARVDHAWLSVMCLPIPINLAYSFVIGRIYLKLRTGLHNKRLYAAYNEGFEAGRQAGRQDSYMAQASFNDLRDLARKHFPPKDPQ